MACCDDPTEPKKIGRRELIRLQEAYGELLRDLLTDNPERVTLKLLDDSNTYLVELAALNAHFPAVRIKAIGLLDRSSLNVLHQIADKSPNSEFAQAAKVRIQQLD